MACCITPHNWLAPGSHLFPFRGTPWSSEYFSKIQFGYADLVVVFALYVELTMSRNPRGSRMYLLPLSAKGAFQAPSSKDLGLQSPATLFSLISDCCVKPLVLASSLKFWTIDFSHLYSSHLDISDMFRSLFLFISGTSHDLNRVPDLTNLVSP